MTALGIVVQNHAVKDSNSVVLRRFVGIFIGGLLSGFSCALTGCESLPSGKPNLGPLNTPSVSGDPCGNVDWFEIGRVDGLGGIPPSTSSYVGRCLSLGFPVKEELYYAGWQRGLIYYCTPERGYDAGRAGESYNDVCPKNLEPAFLRRFQVGTQIASLEKKSITLESALNQKLEELATIAGTDSRQSILDDAMARQAALRAELKTLRDALASTLDSIRKLEKSATL